MQVSLRIVQSLYVDPKKPRVLVRVAGRLRRAGQISIQDATLGGVKVKIATRRNASAAKSDRVMINLHGGAVSCRG